MRPVPLSVLLTPVCASSVMKNQQVFLEPSSSARVRHRTNLGFSYPGCCRASQVVEFFPSLSPEIVVREAKVEDLWEIAETHCSVFFPTFSLPLDFLLRMNRVVGMLAGFTIPSGSTRTCFVAVLEPPLQHSLTIAGFDAKLILNQGYITGILTVDTVADFLPRKGPFGMRRTGIAYISNVAVREMYRRNGIAKKLVGRAEDEARRWGCRSIALHCDSKNTAATKLYIGEGYKFVKIPEGANWPVPKSSPDSEFHLMMKRLIT